MRPLGRESKFLLLCNERMGAFPLAQIWFVFDVCLTALRQVPLLGLAVIALKTSGVPMGNVASLSPVTNTALNVLKAWAVSECAFFVYARYVERRRMLALQPLRETRSHQVLAEHKASALLARVLKTSPSALEFFIQWLHDDEVDKLSPPSLVEIQELFAFLFFAKESPSELSFEQQVQLNGLVQQFAEALAPVKLTDSHGLPPRRLMKFYFDRAEGTAHRPLAYWAVVDGLFQSVLVPLRMAMHGFTEHQKGSFKYWLRPGTNTSLKPICFFHGLGVGLLPYLSFITAMEKSHPDRTIILAEVGIISQRFDPSDVNPEQYVSDVVQAVKSIGYSRINVVAHSYGTFIASWLTKEAPEGFVASLCLIDPAAILLHHTDVCYNLLYKKRNSTSLERVLDYVMRGDAFFYLHLRHSFTWFKNVLFLEDVNCPVLVVLSDADQVIPVQQILAYVQAQKRPVHVLQDCDHGGFSISSAHTAWLVRELETIVSKD